VFTIAVTAVYFVRFSDPMIRMGFASGIATFSYIALRWARSGTPRRLHAGSGPEPCLRFLRSELERKREGLLEIRWTLLLLFPAFFASWWGGAPVAIAKWLHIDSHRLTRFQESPAPSIVFALILAFSWIGFGKEARAIGREVERLGGEDQQTPPE
jgi:hypothetical protein